MGDLDKFIRVEEVVARTGINPRTLDRRLASGEISGVVRDPRDRRRRLVPIEAVERLLTLRMTNHPEAAAA